MAAITLYDAIQPLTLTPYWQSPRKCVRLVRIFLDKSESRGQFWSETTRETNSLSLPYFGQISMPNYMPSLPYALYNVFAVMTRSEV